MRINKQLVLAFIFFMMVVASFLYWQNGVAIQKVSDMEAQTKKSYRVTYKIFDVVFREHYYKNGCWTCTDEDLEAFYSLENHYKTSQYAFLMGLVDKKHVHWADQWSRCE